MSASERRIELGDIYLNGRGFEIGAGATPSYFQGVDHLTFVDKRSADELKGLFKTSIEYEVLTLEAALKAPKADFLTAHHVIEHAPDPIATIAGWASLIRQGGRVYLSLPGATGTWERERAPVPFSHLLHDYIFSRDENSFESRQHIPHFINQWTMLEPAMFWFTDEGVPKFARFSLWEVTRDGPVDIHWHAYSLEVMRQVMESAFWLAGSGLTWLHTEADTEELHLIAEVTARGDCPAALAQEVEAIRSSLVKTLSLVAP